ncbi:DUF3866 family protein [Bacillus piscicola]|uniref:DUF3866 family protein n=1 Tax=Bacillus piscicola TaxID=1632684 RepID=UPI001F094CCE|nr:DUF3866 family protein [Bacillus piscicola]
MYAEQMVRVEGILEEDNSIQKLRTDGGLRKAILYKACSPSVRVGDTVKVNVTAGLLQLGTGGWDIVIASAGHMYQQEGKGHIMKARYTSCQHSVLAVDAPEHPDHYLFHDTFQITEKPVMLAELHSMLPIMLGTFLMKKSNVQIGVILSDEASLPAGLSDHMRIWKKHPQVHVVTTGQAFGGNEEAVTIPNALLWLFKKKAVDVFIISMGPGTVGTATPLGFSGMALAEWANITSSLGGRPIWVPRVSFQEKRERHYGISHHTLTPLLRFAHAPSTLVLPKLTAQNQQVIEKQLLEKHVQSSQHDVHVLNVEEWLQEWKAWSLTYPLPIRKMGNDVKRDPDYIKGVLAPVKYVLEDII